MADPKEVIDAIRDSNLDAARDATRSLLYQKAAEHMSARKDEVASSLSQALTVDVDDVFNLSEKTRNACALITRVVTRERRTLVADVVMMDLSCPCCIPSCSFYPNQGFLFLIKD